MTKQSREMRIGGQRGIALIATLMMITVFLILIGVLMENLAKEVNITGMHGHSNAALRADYYAIEQMQYQIEFNDAGAAPGVVPAPIVGTLNDDDGTVTNYTVSVDAYRWTTSVLPYYMLHATATTGASTRSVDALIQKMPFSAFNYFTISEVNNHGAAVVYTNGESFDGPVYSGGPMNIFYTDAQPAIFTNEVWTASAPNWIPAAPSTAADWSAIITDQANFHQVSQPLQLPTATDNNAVLNASLTGNPTIAGVIPGAAGLYINGNPVAGGGGPVNSGIFIKGWAGITSTVVGNVETLQLEITNGGPIVQYDVVIDVAGGTTRVNSGPPLFTPIASYSGIPSGEQPPSVTGANGAIYATGGMQFAAGDQFHGLYTFAVPDNSVTHPSIVFLGGQQYSDPVNDELAFWANDIVLADSTNGNIEVDGLLLTGYYGECSAVCNDGTFYNVLCPAVGTCAPGTGVLTLKGSLIENVRGKRGTLGSTISGFSTDSVYDSRLATKPPPFTPTTTQYNIIALCTTDAGTTCGQ